MKIKRSTSTTSTKRQIPMNDAAKAFIGDVMNADDAALLVLIEPKIRMDVIDWPFGRSDLHHWADVLDKFDGLYERLVAELWDPVTGCQGKPFSDQTERLVCALLGFTRGLLEYCSSRNLFNSYEHLKSFLASSSTPVVEMTLELLVLPARKLEAQQSLRRTFQETIGVDELAILGNLTHPPFIEFHGVRTRRINLVAFRSLPRHDSELVRLQAMTVYLMFMGTLDVELDSSLFSAQPTVIGDVARSLGLPQPGTGSSLRRETAAIGLLRAALRVPSKSSEVVYALSLSAGHGPVASIARLLGDALREQRDPGLHHFFISSFLDLLTALALSFEADMALVQCGLVEELVRSVGNCDPRQYKLMERVLTVVDILLHRLAEALDAFFAAEGLHSTVRQIMRLTLDRVPAGLPESDLHMALPDLDHDHTSLLNSHLRLLDRLLSTAGGDDRLRNLVEGNLFKALRIVFLAPGSFPPETLAFSVSILSAFVHHEPTSLSFLQEQGVPQALLAALASPHPLPPQGDLLVRLPQAFSALCLNSLGVEQFAACNPVRKLLLVFLDSEAYMKPLKSHLAASEIGRGLDEFMRHQPAFRDSTIEALLEVLDGLQPLLEHQKGLHSLEALPKLAEDPNPTAMPWSQAHELVRKREPDPGLVMFDLFSVALEGILQSPAHAHAFLRAGGLERLFRLYSAPGLPYDFPARSEAHSIAHLFRLLTETPESAAAEEITDLPSVLAVAWNHVFACSPQITELFLAHHEATRSDPNASAYFLSQDLNSANAVFEALCSLQAILGLLSELYLQHSYTASRQAAQVLPGLATAEGEAAMVFLSLLLGASVSEVQLLSRQLSPSLLEAARSLDKVSSSDPNETVMDPQTPCLRSTRMLMSVVERLPSLITVLFGGVARMLSHHSNSAFALRRPAGVTAVSDSALQKVSSLLANCLASNLRALSGDASGVLNLIGLAGSLFFDEAAGASTRMAIQALPISTFGHIGGLDDLAVSVQSCLTSGSSPEMKQKILDSYLSLLGRVTNVSCYRSSTWDDLNSVGFPDGLRAWFKFAARTASWFWSTADFEMKPSSLRLLLALSTNLCVINDNSAKAHEETFYSSLRVLRDGDEDFSWLRDPATLLPSILSRARLCEEVSYDACLLFTHLLVPVQWSEWWRLMTDSPLVIRHLAILLSGHMRPVILEHLIRGQEILILGMLKGLDAASLLLAGLLTALHSVGGAVLPDTAVPLFKQFLGDALASPMADCSTLHAALFLAASLTRLVSFDAEELKALVPRLLNAVLTALPDLDIRHRAMLPLALLALRHLAEGPQLVNGLMEPELLARVKTLGARDRRLPLTSLFPSLGPSPLTSQQPLQAEILWLRDPSALQSTMVSCMQIIDGQDGLALRPEVASLEHKTELLNRLYDEPNAACNTIVDTLLSCFQDAQPRLPVFASAAESAAAEKDQAIVAAHFQRMAVLAALSELASGLPAFHSALLQHQSFPALLRQLFDEVVPCGDLATASPSPADQAANTSSILFVSGPVWVDHFLGHVVLGSSVPGMPATLERMQRHSGLVVAALTDVIGACKPSNSYDSMSRLWCLSMTVYSLLNIRSPQLHKQSEAAQSCLAKAMLECRTLKLLAKLLAALPVEAPGQSMVAAKLVLNLETLAKHAKTLLATVAPKKRGTGLNVSTVAEGQFEAADAPTIEHESLSEETSDTSMTSDSGTEDSAHAMEDEEFGYAHSEEDDSMSSMTDSDGMAIMDDDSGSDEDDSMDIDLLGTDTGMDTVDDSDSGSGTSGDTSFSTTDDDSDEYTTIDEDAESVHIVLRPGEEGYVYGDEIASIHGMDLDEDSSDEDEALLGHHHHDHNMHLFDEDIDDEAEDAPDEYDSDADEDEDEYGGPGDDLLAADSGTEAGDDAGEAHMTVNGRRYNLQPGSRMPRMDGPNLDFLDSILGADGTNRMDAFSSLAVRGAAAGDLYGHPLLGRDPDAPACLSTRSVDIALFSSNTAAIILPYRLKAGLGAPFDGNREMLHSPQPVPTARRWAQAARLYFGMPADAASLVNIQETVNSLRAEYKQKEEEERKRLEEEQKKVEEEKKKVEEEKKKLEDDVKAAQPSVEVVAPNPEIVTEILPRQPMATPQPIEPQEFLDVGPDAEFLLALPFDIRAEVIEQYLREERRGAIATALGSANIPVRISIDPEFLQRLPADLRTEYERMSDRDAQAYNRRVNRNLRPEASQEHIDDEESEDDEFFFEDFDEEEGEAPESGAFLQQLARSLQQLVPPAAGGAVAAATEGNGAERNLANFIQRLQQNFARPAGAHRIEVRVHDPSGAILPPAAVVRPASPSLMLGAGRASPLPASALTVDRSTLASLLAAYYAPSMADKRTHHRLLASLCVLPLEAGGGAREALLGTLLRVLEVIPVDDTELVAVLEGQTLPKRPQCGTATPTLTSAAAPPTTTVVILQRTLQLLHYLVAHDDVCKAFFTRPSAAPWTIRRRDRTTEGGHKDWEVRHPLILLLACLEKGPILHVGMLVEFALSLLATVSSPLKRPSTANANTPVVAPRPFLHALVRALGSAELTPKAFGHASTLVQHLAHLPDVPEALLAELSDAAIKVAEHASRDLAHLQTVFDSVSSQYGGTDGTDSVASVTMATDPALAEALRALSSPASAQIRLLRLLKMALVLAQQQRPIEAAALERLVVDLDRPQWSVLLTALPALLADIEARQLLHVAMGLLPAIETLFLHQRLQANAKTTSSEGAFPDESALVAFAEAHRKLLNAMIRTQPALLTATGGSFQALARAPRVLDFDNKRALFRTQLAALKRSAGVSTNTINLNVRRPYIFQDTFTQLTGRTGAELRAAKLNIRFHGEQGVDAGGLTREWYAELCKQMFNPDNGLFLPSAVDSVAMQPNRMSGINQDHLMFFKFVGRIIAKAIVDGRLLDCHFTRAFYKHMLGLPVNLADLEAIDPEYCKSLQWILANDITGVLDDDLAFTIEADEFGVVRSVDLKPDGASIPVTEANKAEYVRLVTEYRLTTAIKPQIDAVLTGLHELLPASLLALFTETELELLISGLPDIDIDDWRAHTEYRSYTIASPQVQWFWRAVRSFDQEERAKLVQFVTGTSKVPLEGWAHLQGVSGRQRFTITKDFGPTDRLPSAHTCFNQLDLPAYESYEDERAQLLKAITEGGTGFGLV